MKYISIGSGCCVKYNINKYRGESETLFFDWLMTSMDSVIDVLSCDNIKDILYFENIIKDIDNPTHIQNSRIVIKSLRFCVSVHDIPINYSDSDILCFIDKFNRIIEYIKSNEKICFIRLGYVTDYQINEFIEKIKKINTDCDFILVIIDNNKKNITEILKQPNLLYIKLNIDVPKDFEWTHQFLNWNKIFLDIENNI